MNPLYKSFNLISQDEILPVQRIIKHLVKSIF